MEALDGFRLRPPPAFFTRCATIAAAMPFSLSRGFCQEGKREGRLRLHGGRIRALIRIEIQGTFCNGAVPLTDCRRVRGGMGIGTFVCLGDNELSRYCCL